jgi:DNA-binding response OmpR family regulator
MATILVVEDNPAVSNLLSRVLERAGYTVLTSTDGIDGLEATRRSRPDLVVLDLALPGLDGWSVVRQLKANRHTAHIPVLGVSGWISDNAYERARKAGCDGFIEKPFDLAQLLAQVAALIKQRRCVNGSCPA